MTVFLLALAGLPPTAGFLGKILILSSSVASGYLWLAVLLIVGTAISLYAYAKVVWVMYAREEGEHHEPYAVRSARVGERGNLCRRGGRDGVLSADAEQRSTVGALTG